MHALIGQRLNELVNELFGADVDDAGFRPFVANSVGDGVDEVRLSETGAAADKQRIVPPAARPRGGHRCSVGEVVRGADDEVREGVFSVEALEEGSESERARRQPWRSRAPGTPPSPGRDMESSGAGGRTDKARGLTGAKGAGRSATGRSSAPSMVQRT